MYKHHKLEKAQDNLLCMSIILQGVTTDQHNLRTNECLFEIKYNIFCVTFLYIHCSSECCIFTLKFEQ